MCKNCFDTEISIFTTSNEFKNFEQRLEQKLRASQGMFYLRQSGPSELISYTIYGCKNCDSKWYLSIPVGDLTGCFLLQDSFQPLLQELIKNDSRWRWGVIITSLLVLFICFLILVEMLN